MRPTNLRLPGGISVRGGLLAAALGATCPLGCSGEDQKPVLEGDIGGSSSEVDCDVDPSLSESSAYDGTFGAELVETICPRRDEDYWRVSTSGANKIVTAEATYQKLSNIRLALEWSGPTGICIDEPRQGCSNSTQCDTGEVCDLARDGCRPGFPVDCAHGNGCDVSFACALGDNTIGTILEPLGGSTLHRVQARFPAVEQGTYIAKIFDQAEQEADPETEYTLTLSESDEPDPGEPNNGANYPTVIDCTGSSACRTTGEEVVGYLATLGDVDWFRVAHDVSGQAVVSIELRWPVGADLDPTWTVSQDDWTFPSLKVVTEGSGDTAEQVRHATLVTPAGSEFLLLVENQQETSDIMLPYTLIVSVHEDPTEPTRDDEPDSASPVDLGAPSPGPTAHRDSGTLVAENDADWYRMDRTGGGSDNSLLYIKVTAPAPLAAGFLMQLTLYRPCTNCPAGSPCLESGACIAPWYILPSPDGPVTDPDTGAGAPEYGGHAPNHLETMVPLYESGTGVVYLAITHIAATPLPIPGYDPATTYDLEIRHYEEPDDEDRLDPDNRFLARPLAENVYRGDFFLHARVIEASGPGGTQWVETPRQGAEGFLVVPDGSYVEEGSCGPVTFDAFDGVGDPATSTTVTLLPSSGTPTNGTFVSTCPPTLPGDELGPDLNLSGAHPTALFYAPATQQSVTVFAVVDGVSIWSMLRVEPTGVIPPASMTVTAENGTAAVRGFQVDGASGVLRINLPAAPSSALPLTLTVAPTATARVACANAVSNACPNLSDPALVGLSNPCTGTLSGAGSKTTCQIGILPGQTSYDVLLSSTATGPVVLDISDDPGPYRDIRFVATAYVGATFAFDPGYWASGFISYSGDQDFFRIPLPNFPDRAGMTVNIRAGASPVDFRILATRGSTGAGAGITRSARDLCGTCGGGGSCDPRNYCTQAALDQSVGAQGTPPECVFLRSSSDLEIWVNDVLANDWELGVPYEFQIELEEGCPSSCDSWVCSR